MRNTILIIEGDDDNYQLIQSILGKTHFKNLAIRRCGSISELVHVNKDEIKIILSNLILPDSTYNETFTLVNDLFSDIPIVILTDRDDDELARKIIHQGAQDYLIKGEVDQKILGKSITYALERKQLQLEIKKTEADYEDLFENGPNPVWILDKETHRFLRVNDAAISKYGYSRDEFLNLTIKDIWTTHEIKRFEVLLEKDLQNPFSDEKIFKHINKTGKSFYVSVYSGLTSFDGRVARLVHAIDVDKKVRAEMRNARLNKLVKKQKEQISGILSSIEDVVWALRADSLNLVYITGNCNSIYGYDPEELSTDTFARLIHPDDAAEVSGRLKALNRTGNATITHRMYDREGTLKYLQLRANFRKGEINEPDMIYGITTDVTESRKIQEKLIQSEHRAASILETITDAFFAFDREFRFTYLNKQAEAIYKIKKEEILGHVLWDCYPGTRDLKFYAEFNRALNSMETRQFEEYSPSIPGWVSVNAYPSAEGLAVYVRDITEEKKLRDELVRNEYELKALINNTKDLVWSLDREYNILSSNDFFQKMAENHTGGKTGKGDVAFFMSSAEKNLEWKNYYDKAFAGESFRVIDEIVYKEESTFYETSFNPVYDAQGVVAGACCFSRDITERRKHVLKIEHQNELLGQIAWMQSHKIRNHVATILGLAQFLNTADPTDETNTTIISGIKETTENLDATIHEINEKTNELRSKQEISSYLNP